MDSLPFLLQYQHYSHTLPHRSLDFQSRMSAIFGEQLRRVSPTIPHVLILTRAYDGEVDAVGLQFAAHGISYLRVDVDTLPTETAFNLQIDRGNAVPSIKSRDWDLYNPRVIWFRQFAITAIPSFQGDPMVQSFVRAEWELAVRSLLSIESAHWINNPDAVNKLDRISQLRVAHSAGLVTPKTLVSNDPGHIRFFISSCSDKVIAKVLGNHFMEPTPGTLYGVFPRIITGSDVDDLKTTVLAPSIYQEYVSHTTEVRVTVVGRDIIAAEVIKTGPEEIWERPDNILIQNHTLPPQVQEKLHEYMKLAHLEYGAFDLLLTPDGRYVFLEVNPTGDWLWLERRDTTINITEKVTSYIIGLMKEAPYDD